MDITPFSVAIVTIAFFLAGTVKGVLGLGLPTISIGLLSIVMSPAQAATLLIIPATITNIQQIRPFALLPALFSRLWPLLACIIIGTLISGGLISLGNSRLAAAILGGILVLYGLVGFHAGVWTTPQHLEKRIGAVAGLLTGLITGATGISVIPLAAYLQSIGLRRDDLVQALGMSFFVATLSLATTLTMNDVMNSRESLASAFCLIPALAGQYAGQAIRSRIDAGVFKKVFLLAMIGLGLYLISKGWT